TYIASFHGKPAPDFAPNSKIYIVDFSYDKKTLLTLAQQNEVVLLDHHKTAQADLEGLPFATFDMNKSGAVLAWEYLHPEKKLPLLLQYVQDRDLWQFKLPYSKELHVYIGTAKYDFADWERLYQEFEFALDDAIEKGKLLLAYDQQNVDSICRQAKLVDFEGYQVPSVNTPLLNSDVGNKLLELYPAAKFSITWYMDRDSEIKISLRSNSDFDVSAIAKKYGGGGHFSAAGCRVNKIP
ncbi:MAG: hypothetical protein A2451_14930, partial [Bdellovibrionales bacterium RIFOXYC2_FULL_39_8]